METSLSYSMRVQAYFAVTFVLILLSAYLAFIHVPPPTIEAASPDVYRIFFVHFPFGILSYVAFAITFVGSVLYLREKDLKWDRIASASATLGVAFAFLVIITGSLWGRVAWNLWWNWYDSRLVTTLILFFVYVAYLGFRASIEERDKKARLSAVVGILAIVTVPLSYFSIYLWQMGALHPVPAKMEYGTLTRMAMYTSLIAFLLLFVSLLYLMVKTMMLSENILTIKYRRRE
jgi:heme exporter protein C